MPQHEIHYNIDDILIGRKFPHVHQMMDIMSKEGPNHRRFFHDDGVVSDMLIATGGFADAWSARYHLIADRIVRDGEAPQELPGNVRQESIIAELLDLITKGEVELVVFPDSVIARLISSINNGTVVLAEPEILPPLRKNYYIKR
ncbi:MAG: hypothetical protein WC119_08610 [Synergistaceae bacterium]|jgi:hypothetical protein|nr:hypothetical protein [Candidatus Omnitrophota bacterium]MDD5526915.1 hypothetical protein [Candidatus Omnitrophota bacterium]